MKIGLTGYPLKQLTGGESLKKTNAAVKKGPADRVDVPVISGVPDKAVVRYLRIVDEILSDIIRMVDDDLSLPGSEGPAAISQAPSRQASMAPEDAVVYLPSGAPAGKDGPEEPAALIIIKDALSSVMKGMYGQQGEKALVDLAKGIAGELSRIDAVMVAGTFDLDSPAVKDKYIISAGAGDGIPVYSVIRHDPSGATVSYGNAAEGIDDAAAASVVARVASFLTRRTDETFSADTFNVPEGPHIGLSYGKQAGDDAASLAGAGLADGTFVLPGGFDPVRAAREVASFLSAGKNSMRSDRVQEDMDHDTAAVPEHPAPADGAYDMFLQDEFPGINVRIVPSTARAFAAVKMAAEENRQVVVAEKLALLADTIGEFIGYNENTEEEGAGEGAARPDAVRMSVKEAVRESLRTAARCGVPSGQAPVSMDEVPEGIGIGEEGMLRVDRKVLAGTFMERKDETTRFIQGFSNALHDRITYFFHPFAGLYAADTGGAAAVRGAGGKEGMADEEEGVRMEFEKRMGEISMLLESSYQLREVFMNMGLSARAGEGKWEK